MANWIKRLLKQQPSQQAENHLRAKWTPSLTKILADLMVEQIHKGNKPNKSFSKKGWNFICDNFRTQSGYWWDNDQLKSCYIALRKQYINVASLLDHCEFKWDETTGMIVATNEAWTRHIKEHPDADAFRTTGCPLYSQLQIIFSVPRISRKHNGLTQDIEETPNLFHSSQCVSMSPEEVSPSDSEKYTDLSGRKRGRTGMEASIAKGIREMAAAAKFRAEAIKKWNEEYSITDCIVALDELQDAVSDQVYFLAIDLFSSRTTRETFLSLNVENRTMWLQGKCSTVNVLR